MTSWLVGAWGALVTTLFIAAFFSSDAASLEPFGRIIYMAMLSLSFIVVALGLMRSHGGER